MIRHGFVRAFLRAIGGLLLCVSACASAWSATPLLLRNPALSQDGIAFLYGGDIWMVARGGGEARRLTSVGSVVAGPYFSPDHTQIAYSSGMHGLTDVYVVSADGGVPRRLTWEPTGSRVAGWTPDGKDVLFASMHASYSDFPRLFRDSRRWRRTRAAAAAAERRRRQLLRRRQHARVRTGRASGKPRGSAIAAARPRPIWLVNIKTLDLEKIPRENSNDSNPVWSRRHGVLSFRPQRPGLAVQLRHRHQAGAAGPRESRP